MKCAESSAPAAASPAAAGFAVRYEIRAEGSVAGKGIFAVDPIPRGALLWRYSPEVVVEHDEASLRARVASLPTVEERVDLLEHVYGWEGAVHEILDDGKYWNHSTAAAQNTGNHPDGSPPGDGVSSYALRDIAPGEELLVRAPCPLLPSAREPQAGEEGKGPACSPVPKQPRLPCAAEPRAAACVSRTTTAPTTSWRGSRRSARSTARRRATPSARHTNDSTMNNYAELHFAPLLHRQGGCACVSAPPPRVICARKGLPSLFQPPAAAYSACSWSQVPIWLIMMRLSLSVG